MNTSSSDSKGNLALVEAYYHHLLQKDFDAMAKCLHPEVLFIGPLAEMSGKKAVTEAVKNLSQILSDIEIRAKFSSNNQIMLAYDFIFPDPIGQLRAAVLMEFEDQLISKIKLFYDGKPFEQKKNEIFSDTNAN